MSIRISFGELHRYVYHWRYTRSAVLTFSMTPILSSLTSSSSALCHVVMNVFGDFCAADLISGLM